MKKKPVPRGRNGGRKPLPEELRRSQLTVSLPAVMVARIRAKGSPTEVIERVLTDHLK